MRHTDGMMEMHQKSALLSIHLLHLSGEVRVLRPYTIANARQAGGLPTCISSFRSGRHADLEDLLHPRAQGLCPERGGRAGGPKGAPRRPAVA
eukprot:Transcript_4702.p3 GENE.Transcript_4702~~Transcript_4702.p3  ORF type:complete len:93 (+),score=11.58 Transcript_4702:500-778(+)